MNELERLLLRFMEVIVGVLVFPEDVWDKIKQWAAWPFAEERIRKINLYCLIYVTVSFVIVVALIYVNRRRLSHLFILLQWIAIIFFTIPSIIVGHFRRKKWQARLDEHLFETYGIARKP